MILRDASLMDVRNGTAIHKVDGGAVRSVLKILGPNFAFDYEFKCESCKHVWSEAKISKFTDEELMVRFGVAPTRDDGKEVLCWVRRGNKVYTAARVFLEIGEEYVGPLRV